MTIEPSDSAVRATHDEDDIESELLYSTREVGVACFPMPDPGLDVGDDD
jgi:hypothetical protein